MIKNNNFFLLKIEELDNWLKLLKVNKPFKYIQLHHTEDPSYKNFNGKNHFEICEEMNVSHKKRGFGGIAQNFTIFPNGDIVVCRNLNHKTIGIKGANDYAINIENLGNFDIDIMDKRQKESITKLTKGLLNKFSIKIDDKCILYHHWFDLKTGNKIRNYKSSIYKSCPGKNFFGGNTFEDFRMNLLPLLLKK